LGVVLPRLVSRRRVIELTQEEEAEFAKAKEQTEKADLSTTEPALSYRGSLHERVFPRFKNLG
jgi:hypothetical protein